MANPQLYSRDKDGIRFRLGTMNTVLPYDQLPTNTYAYLQNVRAYKALQIISRATAGTPVLSGLPTPVHTLGILNDTSGTIGSPYYVRVVGAAGVMYVNSTEVASGLSGDPFALCPFRPNTSVAPWDYIGNSSEAVTLTTKFAIDGSATTYPLSVTPTSYCFGAIKTRSDGLVYKTGIEEPQTAPTVSTQNTTTTGTDTLPATTYPWTNVGGTNPSPYNYGQTNAADGTAPIVITGGGATLIQGSTVTISISGTASVNPYGSVTVPPSPTGNTSAGYPGSTSGISGTASIFIGAFTDTAGNVIAPGGSLPAVFFIDPSGSTVTVPSGASQLQVGVDSLANTFSTNSGSFTLDWSVTVPAIATVISTLGNVTAYIWGDSPHTGPVANYIWKNPNDGGTGTPRSITSSSLSPNGTPQPLTVTNNSWMFGATSTGTVDPTNDSPSVPVNWSTLNSDGSTASTIPLFDPALESEGYQDFNCCIVGSLFVPVAGTYAFQFQYKDQFMFGLGGGATAVYSSGVAGSTTGSYGQKISVVNSLPLAFVSTANGAGSYQTTVLNITFPAAGVYAIELDWDYWYHTGRSLIMTATSTSPNTPVIPPLPQGVRTGVSYRYVYRSSLTGATSNPSPESPIQDTPVLANVVEAVYSPDPQVDKVDYYRIDDAITNFTYVATGPNDGLGGTSGGLTYDTSITDELSDTEIAANQILQFDNYEPFPVIDLPHKGTVNVTGGVIQRTGGDYFDTRWLPGTVILIGFPTSTAFVLTSRPTSTTEMTIDGVPDGTNLDYEIPEPDLAAQPLPYVWGPTANAGYMFGVGDMLNPGTLYFTKGNNPDSAPQTNQMPVTSPDEPLQNGVIVAGLGMVFSTERRWLIYPTFVTAYATVQGVAGSPFNLVLGSSERGLYIPTCVCTDGANTTFFRAKDGIYACEFGGPDQYICGDIYNLFPREGVIPQPITIAGNTVYPPDDTNPAAQKLSWGQTVLFYDYEDTTGTPRTLVYDFIAKGWSVDVGQYLFQSHAWEVGPNTDTVMVGCNDGSVRLLGSGNAETCTSIVIPGVQNAGDARAFKRIGDIYVQAIAQTSNPITVALYSNRYATALTGFSPTSLTGTGTLTPYIIDFSSGYGDEVIDVGIVLSWPTAAADLLDLWAPTFTFFPEATQDRPTEWDDCGYPGNKFIQGLLLECNTFGNPKAISVQRSDDFSSFTPNESPITAAHQRIVPLSFTPPFLAHNVRIVSTDGVQWRHGPDAGWRLNWQFQPFPEPVLEWATELTSLEGIGWQHLRLINLEYISTAAITLSFGVDSGNGSIAPATITIPSSGGVQTKTKLIPTYNKWKLISFAASSTAPMNLFLRGAEFWVRSWGDPGPYRKLTPFGGMSTPSAEI